MMKITFILIFWTAAYARRSRSRSSSSSKSRSTNELKDSLEDDISGDTEQTSSSYKLIHNRPMKDSRDISIISAEFTAENSRKSPNILESKAKPYIKSATNDESKTKRKKKNRKKNDIAAKKVRSKSFEISKPLLKTKCTQCIEQADRSLNRKFRPGTTVRTMGRTFNSNGFSENWFPRSSNINLKLSLVLIIFISI